MGTISYRILTRRGTEAARSAGTGSIMSDELNSTTDQKRLFIDSVPVGAVVHEAVSAAARLALHTTDTRGCFSGDLCQQTDTAPASWWVCTAGNGTASSEWACISHSGPVGIAASALSGHRAMTFGADGLVTYAQPGDVVAGVTEHAYEAGSLVAMRDAGLVVESSWAWTPGGTVFLAADGGLTQSVPLMGAMQVIGRAVDATRLQLSFQPTITLS